MENIRIRKATQADKAQVINFDQRLDPIEHIKLRRAAKITQAILKQECYIIFTDQTAVGFLMFNYRFFDQGWIELMIIAEAYRGQGIAGQTFDLICEICKTEKVFTSTNRSNMPMQKALAKAGFSFAGKLNGLDEGDPELFYYKQLDKKEAKN